MSSVTIKVLLVEDNLGDARLLKESLKEQEGCPFELIHVDRLSEALRVLGVESFGIVLLDLSLPDAQGLDTIRRLHSHAEHVPIVVLTGLNDEEVALAAVEQGAQDYLIKGQVDGSLLARSLRYAIQRHSAEEILKERNRELVILRKISETILGSVDLESVTERILEHAMLSGSFDLGNIRLLDRSDDTLKMTASRGYRDPANVLSHRIISRTPGKESTFGDRIFKETCIEERVQRSRGFRTMRIEGVESFITVPIRANGEGLGIIQLGSRMARKFRPEDVRLLETIGNQMGVAVQKAQFYEAMRIREAQLQESNRMLSALHAVASATNQSLEVDRVLQAAIAKINDIFHFDAIRIHLHEQNTDEYRLKASLDSHPDHFNKEATFLRSQGITGAVGASGKPLIFEDVKTNPLYEQLSRTKVAGEFGYHFFAVLPISGKLDCLGALVCVGVAPRKLTAGENQLLEAIAHQLAVAIENTKLYENIGHKIQELQHKTSELEQANKAKDEFLSIMSHELRTPLNVILGYSKMVKEGIFGNINVEQEKALETVLARANDQLLMINSVLQVSKIQAGAVSAVAEEVNLSGLLDEIRQTYDLFSNEKLAIHWDITELPVIKSDGEKLKHIFQNLIGNATKFTEQGSIRISGRYIWDSMQLELKVSDTGIGIAQEMLPQIFEMFRQLDSSNTRRYEGVGIGLYIVKKFTDLLGGNIDVESEFNKGSTFTLTIPAELATSKCSARTTYLNANRSLHS
jgi:signal transduction histidine kinase